MNKYYWKKQSKNSYLCGQVAVSVILNKSLKETIKLFGHSNCTPTKSLVRVLRSQGIKCDNKLMRKKQPFLGIAKLSRPNSSAWHWVVVWGDKIFDGICGEKNGTVKWKKDRKMTSYLEIYER